MLRSFEYVTVIAKCGAKGADRIFSSRERPGKPRVLLAFRFRSRSVSP
jgi:hypothetical protein